VQVVKNFLQGLFSAHTAKENDLFSFLLQLILDTFAREEKEKEKKNDWKRIEEAKITVASLRPDQKRTDVDIFEHGEYRIVSCTCGVWTPDASLTSVV